MADTTNKVWFLRNGDQLNRNEELLGGKRYPFKIEILDQDRALTSEKRACDRCGGQGGHSAWNHTGWTCFKCNGNRFIESKEVKLYSASKVNKLDILAKKRLASKLKKEAERQAADKKKRAGLQEENQLLNEDKYPSTLKILREYNGKDSFLVEIKKNAFSGYLLTDNQAKAVITVYEKLTEKERWDGLIQTIEKNQTLAPTGRHELTGYVLSAKWQEQGYGRSGLKILFLDERGFKVYVTSPKGLTDHMTKGSDGDLILSTARKLKITFTATLKTKEDYFAFGTRPSKCKALSQDG